MGWDEVGCIQHPFGCCRVATDEPGWIWEALELYGFTLLHFASHILS